MSVPVLPELFVTAANAKCIGGSCLEALLLLPGLHGPRRSSEETSSPETGCRIRQCRPGFGVFSALLQDGGAGTRTGAIRLTQRMQITCQLLDAQMINTLNQDANPFRVAITSRQMVYSEKEKGMLFTLETTAEIMKIARSSLSPPGWSG